MSSEDNEALVRRLVDPFNQRNRAAFYELTAPDFVLHHPRPALSEKKGNQPVEMHIALTEEASHVPLWPWEEQVISGADYQRSLDGFTRFVEEVEVKQLQTLEDLSAVASLIGHDLSVVARALGQKIEHKTDYVEPGVSEPISCLEREYVLTQGLADQQIVVTARKGHSLLVLYRLCGFPGYRRAELSIRLPSDRDIAIGQKPNVDEESLYALDLRGARRAYHPVKEPHTSETQQGFADLLKDALRTLIAVIAVKEKEHATDNNTRTLDGSRNPC